ncbi:hypothetical protein BDF14DRAFT_1727590, partial [Spinellus fusiger]
NKRHTLKTIKNREECHPSSRKARQLTRVFLRKERLDQRSVERSNTNTKCKYLERNNEELEKLVKERQIGNPRPKTNRENLLLALIENEKAEYKSGFEIPDMTNGKTLRLLREWDGDLNSMARMKSIRIIAPSKEVVINTEMQIENPATEVSVKKGLDAMEE